eukprot:1468078-Pleurochrysis_carterae.AAC.1
MACVRFCVNRNGTRSGVARLRPWSKRHAKSTCISDPVVASIKMFSRCRSPSLRRIGAATRHARLSKSTATGAVQEGRHAQTRLHISVKSACKVTAVSQECVRGAHPTAKPIIDMAAHDL